MHESKTSEKVEKIPLRKTQSDCGKINYDSGVSTPITSSFIIPASTTIKRAKSRNSAQNSLESSIEDEMRQGTPALSSSTPDSSYGSPRFGSLKAVKNRYLLSPANEFAGS